MYNVQISPQSAFAMTETKGEVIVIKVSKTDKAAFQRAADAQDLGISAWLRALARRNVRKLNLLPKRKIADRRRAAESAMAVFGLENMSRRILYNIFEGDKLIETKAFTRLKEAQAF
jgi:hypothetical protein